MNTKNMKNHLYNKMNDWVASIEDEQLRKKVWKNCFVTGGIFVSLLSEEKIHDYDIYIMDKQVLIDLIRYYLIYVNNKDNTSMEVSTNSAKNGLVNIFIKSSGYYHNIEKGKNRKNYAPKYISSNAITLYDGIQLITRFYGSPSEIHKNFDFIHCTCYYVPSTNELYLPSDALVSIINKELHYVGSRYPICSLFRMRKFMKRGWIINAGQIVKMAYQISKLDLDDFTVFEDQLVGVDTLYFAAFISEMKKQREESPMSFILNETAVSKIIDKVFGE